MGSVGDFVKVMSMPCKEHAAIISRLTSEPGAYSGGMRAGLWLHERVCTGCKAYHRQLTTLRRGFEAWAGAESVGMGAGNGRCPEGVVRRIRERVGRG
ncbi:MAG: hypothetical protein KF768_07495 [Phycisphaeraceae bacterium]|nr:hypothetical protein [Phycisphaeraceae bacterium]